VRGSDDLHNHVHIKCCLHVCNFNSFNSRARALGKAAGGDDEDALDYCIVVAGVLQRTWKTCTAVGGLLNYNEVETHINRITPEQGPLEKPLEGTTKMRWTIA
jgi:hypothetical protein